MMATADTMSALVAKINALKWGERALCQARPYDLVSIVEALGELVTLDRCCLVILDGATHDSERVGSDLRTVTRRTFTLLISAYNAADRQAALTGDASAPGLMEMVDAILAGIVGLLGDGAYVRPLSGEPFMLSDAQREDTPGRVCWSLRVEVVGGQSSVSLGSRPIW